MVCKKIFQTSKNIQTTWLCLKVIWIFIRYSEVQVLLVTLPTKLGWPASYFLKPYISRVFLMW